MSYTLPIRVVEANSVEDYLHRYYRPDRLTPETLAVYKQDFERNGYVETSHHDNVMGCFIGWPRLSELMGRVEAPAPLTVAGQLGLFEVSR